ncbi:MAG: response regulator FixJ [Parvibaculum sp.]|uniref:response regulator FixJ n=1 Tax=Parvibaculum sp. TaxID=2024848 RepID=UPI0028406C4F|nr:response regulator FixJ [Parvibaculum sp.]MDR3500159.1 response regulator FixJ [Parvibaculum sp.]
MNSDATVFIVDDDADVRDSLRALLESANYKVNDYGSAKAFLAEPVKSGGCVIVDIRMPDMDGLELQEELVKLEAGIPVIVVTGHGDVPLAVRAMKAGATDFIEKPYDDELLLQSVRRAMAASTTKRASVVADPAIVELLASLTPREREVLEHLIAGRPNKVIAFELGISPRTVEIHRAHLTEKMKVRSLPELVRVALAAGVMPADGK